MSKDLFIRILKPITGYTEDRIYDEPEVKPLHAVYYGNAAEGEYFRKLRVRSVYAALDDMKAYVAEKYALGKIGDCSMSLRGGREWVIFVNGKTYPISFDEEEALKKPHISEAYYCNVSRDFCVDVYMGNVLTKLVEKDFEVVDDALIENRLVSDEYGDEDEDALENCFAYEMNGDGKLLSALLAAREIAKRTGCVAIAEYN